MQLTCCKKVEGNVYTAATRSNLQPQQALVPLTRAFKREEQFSTAWWRDDHHIIPSSVRFSRFGRQPNQWHALLLLWIKFFECPISRNVSGITPGQAYAADGNKLGDPPGEKRHTGKKRLVAEVEAHHLQVAGEGEQRK